MPQKEYSTGMSVGEVVVRHLRCCVAHDEPVGACDRNPIFDVPRDRVVQALRAMPTTERHAVLTYARVGPSSKSPWTGVCTIARRRGETSSGLRLRMLCAADTLTELLAR